MIWKKKRFAYHSENDLYIIKKIRSKKWRLFVYDDFDEEYMTPFKDFATLKEAKHAAVYDYYYPDVY